MALTQAIRSIPKVFSSPVDPSQRSVPSLIPEIRSRVYEFLLCMPSEVRILRSGDQLFSRDRHRDLRDTGIRVKVRGGLAIVLACRQVYHEASGIFYSQKTFRHARSSDAPTASGTILVCAGWQEMLSARLSQTQGGYDMVLLST
jgi:hypothetical protein